MGDEMQCFNSLTGLARTLPFIILLSGTVFADCAVVTPEEAQYYYEQGLKNVILKVLFLIPTIILVFTVAWKLARSTFGWKALVLTAISSIPILLIVLFLELWSMECGIGGIAAPYYLIVLLAVLAVFLAIRYAETHPTSS